MTSSPTTVIKIGGSMIGQHERVLRNIAALHQDGHRLVIVHGGSKTITKWLHRNRIKSTFHRGLRVTTEPILEVVVAVLVLINKRLVAELQSYGARAYGLSGADDAILRARRYDSHLGLVGKIVGVDTTALHTVLDAGAVAVLAPFAIQAKRNGNGSGPSLLNVNADTVAGEVAAALSAQRLVMITNVAGVEDESGLVMPQLSAVDARALVANNGFVTEGMIPKIEAGLIASERGVTTTISDGRNGSLRRLLANEGKATRTAIGTTIT